MKVKLYERKRDKTKRKLLAIMFLIIFFMYLILHLIKIPQEYEQDYTTKELIQKTELNQEPKQLKSEQCYLKTYTWSWQWQGWAELENNFVSPYFWIMNFEDRPAIFEVRFAFFDNSEYPYDVIRGREYEDFKGFISGNDATMFSNWIDLKLDARENRTITIPTLSPNPDTTYWALADVNEPPSYEVCVGDSYKDIIIQAGSGALSENITTIKVVEEKISLWQWILRKAGGGI